MNFVTRVPDHYKYLVNKKIKQISKLSEELYGLISENGYYSTDFCTKKVFVYIGSLKLTDMLNPLLTKGENNEVFYIKDFPAHNNTDNKKPKRGNNKKNYRIDRHSQNDHRGGAEFI